MIGAGHSNKRFPKNVSIVARELKKVFRDFAHYNLEDPFDELLFIMLSTKTSEPSYLKSFRELKKAFPTKESLVGAATEKIERSIAQGGLSKTKSKAIETLVIEVVSRFSCPTLDPLRWMTDEEAETFLTSLSGVGTKTARCVLMYSLGRKVFPVDTHCWRIALRLGWVRKTHKDGHCSTRDMDRLQSRIPPELMFSLHVNFVSLGRKVCTARKPKCGKCPIETWCKKIGVGQEHG